MIEGEQKVSQTLGHGGGEGYRPSRESRRRRPVVEAIGLQETMAEPDRTPVAILTVVEER